MKNEQNVKSQEQSESASNGLLDDDILTHNKLYKTCKEYCDSFNKYNSTLKLDDLFVCNGFAANIKNLFSI